MADELGRQAKATEVDVARGDIAMAYGRAARAVRFTIALQSKLIADFEAPSRAPAAPAAPAKEEPAELVYGGPTRTGAQVERPAASSTRS